MSRVHLLLGRLGAAGVLGLGVLLFCLPFYVSALRPLKLELAAERAAQAREAAGTRRAAAPPARERDLAGFQALFPPAELLTEEVERLYRLARAEGLRLAQGEYRMEKGAGGLVAYRVSLPVRGTYAQIRGFVGAVLAQMPIASVDALRFERRKSGETQLEAQIRLTVHLRPAEASP